MPEEVLNELRAKDDDLLVWVQERKNWLVAPTSVPIMLTARRVLREHPRLTEPLAGKGTADPFVIATALERNKHVVTEEKGGSSNKPKIPYVCNQMRVECMTVIEMIRREGWTF